MNLRYLWLPLVVLTCILCAVAWYFDGQLQNRLRHGAHLALNLAAQTLSTDHSSGSPIRPENGSGEEVLWTAQFDARGNSTGVVKERQLHGLQSPIPAPLLEQIRLNRVLHHEISTISGNLFVRDEFISRSEGPTILRVAFRGQKVRESMSLARIALILTVLVLIAVGLGLAQAGSLYTSRTLRRMLTQVRPIAKALSARSGLQRQGEEIATIAKSVRRLANTMEETVAMLADERNRFSTVLESMDTGVMSLDEHGVISMANPAAQRMLSMNDSMVGLQLVEVWRTPAIHELVKEAIREGNGIREIELSSPVRRVLRVHASHNSHEPNLVLVLDEITRLRALETIRKDFVANVSHELRTPVSVIQANAETLLAGAMQDSKSGPMFLEAILRNARRLSQLITDLLDLAQLESGNYAVKRERISLMFSWESALENLNDKAQAKNMEILQTHPETVEAWGDTRAVTQVLVNYLDNAIKYNPEGGIIRLRTLDLNDRIRIEVEDDGPGIEPRHFSRLFERFYRIDTGRSRELGGTGLGLSIVKHLALGMGGRVGVHAGSDRGSVFWLELPHGAKGFAPLVEDEDGEEEE